jgi:type IV pilus assembly protein PilX
MNDQNQHPAGNGRCALLAKGKPAFTPNVPGGHGTEKGVVLFMALIALVAMTLAAIALVRSVDTSNLVAGNVALKQGAVHEADKIMNIAFNCLDRGGALLNAGSLGANSATCNYYASLQPDLVRPYGIPDVLESAPGGITEASTRNTTTYVIERMCTAPGTWTPVNCVESPFGRAARFTDRGVSALTPPQALYRISVKVSGPRNVAAYSQMVLNATP